MMDRMIDRILEKERDTDVLFNMISYQIMHHNINRDEVSSVFNPRPLGTLCTLPL